MKRILTFILVCLLLIVSVYAADNGSCTVAASAVPCKAGETVDVSVSVSGNPGFTNYAILLDYDRSALTLTALTPAESGLFTSVNCDYKAADAKSYGFVSAAGEDEQSGDGVLFTATFRVADGFTGSASVTPIVQYIRNNAADHKIFAELRAHVSAGAVMTGLRGDVNGDSSVTLMDAMTAYNMSCGLLTVNTAADVNGDSSVTLMDAMLIYNISLGG